jgi:nicotinamide/nicotinate riboside kinase
VSRFSSALSYVRDNGALPPFLKSKEDLNEIQDSGISDETVERLRKQVREKLKPLLLREGESDGQARKSRVTIAFLEGFLLYAPPSMSPSHTLRPIHSKIHVPLFLPATYALVKARREGRSGYVTIGPPPKPSAKPENEATQSQQGEQQERAEENHDEELPEQDFWEDPPGYVDDIVWSHYINDHAWLLEPASVGEHGEGKSKEGGNVKEDVGVRVAPGKGEASMIQMLEWSIEEVVKGVKTEIPS